MGVLDKRTGVAIEVDRLLGVEGHIFLRIHLQNKIFERTQTHHAGDCPRLFFRDTFQLAQFL
ncbi:hypothetical protein SDC9_186891 [bioreactor metagenome]|uniref:Uncharacterized protein n=1 Tax=bioreactor metagenome TaxID=1076179 RepID=A0A645HVH2_9ZZZZ